MTQYDPLANRYTMDPTDLAFTLPTPPATGHDAEVIGNALANTITGNDGNNTIQGGGGNDEILGGDGNDSLDGGTGDDRMTGGLGDDTYVVDSAQDVVVEGADGGTDTIVSVIDFDLSDFLDLTGTPSVENLTLGGTGDIGGSGTRFANTMTGNAGMNYMDGLEGNDVLDGRGGNDALDGGLGDDLMIGGTGDDIYIVNSLGDVVREVAGEGRDVVWTNIDLDLRNLVEGSVQMSIEDFLLMGNGNLNGIGNDLANLILGNNGVNELQGLNGNDTLDGGGGADNLIGGFGDDVYIVDLAGDTVTEEDASGRDTVRAAFSYTLATNFEDLTLTGTGNFDGTGTDLANLITGNGGSNELQGLSGDDTLDGGSGADRLIGGTGDDVYVVDNTGDAVVEEGNDSADEVSAWISPTLGDGLEFLTLSGSASINGTGNDARNFISGNDAANVLDGKGGADNLAGGEGDDTYVIDGTDVLVEGENKGNDTVKAAFAIDLRLAKFANIEHITLSGTGDFGGTGTDGDNRILGNGGANMLSGLGGSDFLDGGAGADVLDGGAGDDLIDGGTGDDRMSGGAGSDRYVVDSAGDVVTDDGTAGDDTVIAKISYTIGATIEKLSLDNAGGNINATGNALDNIIFGNAGSNVVDGGGGRDELYGATGSDTVYGGEGDDTIHESGSDNDVLDGGAGNDRIEGEGGNDRLDGGSGIDTLVGGAGDDTYVVDSSLDVITEDAGQGTDTIVASISYTLASGLSIESLSAITGTAAIALTGNEAGNILTGNDGANTLDGAAGADVMTGGGGDDTYMVDSALDVVVEAAGGGTDTILTGFTYALAAGSTVESLTATGITAVALSGNEGANILTGNAFSNNLTAMAGNDTLRGDLGDDRLAGGGGLDLMNGGAGRDVFVFDTALAKTTAANKKANFDQVSDYVVRDDSIQLDNAIFRTLGRKGSPTNPVKLDKKFFSLDTAKDKDDHVIYNRKTGVVSYDVDGTGSAKAIEFAKLSPKLKMTAAEFFVI